MSGMRLRHTPPLHQGVKNNAALSSPTKDQRHTRCTADYVHPINVTGGGHTRDIGTPRRG